MGKVNYKDLNDSTLAALTDKGDEKAFEELMIRYLKLINILAEGCLIDGYATDDLVQEGMLSFLIACKKYDGSAGASYKTFAVKCTKNRYRDLLKKTRSKSAVPDSSVDLTENMDEKLGETRTTEDYFQEKEYIRTMLDHLNSVLKDEEKDVFNMYVQGYSYSEIADELKMTKKKVDNILQKVKRKLRE